MRSTRAHAHRHENANDAQDDEDMEVYPTLNVPAKPTVTSSAKSTRKGNLKKDRRTPVPAAPTSQASAQFNAKTGQLQFERDELPKIPLPGDDARPPPQPYQTPLLESVNRRVVDDIAMLKKERLSRRAELFNNKYYQFVLLVAQRTGKNIRELWDDSEFESLLHTLIHNRPPAPPRTHAYYYGGGAPGTTFASGRNDGDNQETDAEMWERLKQEYSAAMEQVKQATAGGRQTSLDWDTINLQIKLSQAYGVLDLLAKDVQNSGVNPADFPQEVVPPTESEQSSGRETELERTNRSRFNLPADVQVTFHNQLVEFQTQLAEFRTALGAPSEAVEENTAGVQESVPVSLFTERRRRPIAQAAPHAVSNASLQWGANLSWEGTETAISSALWAQIDQSYSNISMRVPGLSNVPVELFLTSDRVRNVFADHVAYSWLYQEKLNPVWGGAWRVAGHNGRPRATHYVERGIRCTLQNLIAQALQFFKKHVKFAGSRLVVHSMYSAKEGGGGGPGYSLSTPPRHPTWASSLLIGEKLWR